MLNQLIKLFFTGNCLHHSNGKFYYINSFFCIYNLIILNKKRRIYPAHNRIHPPPYRTFYDLIILRMQTSDPMPADVPVSASEYPGPYQIHTSFPRPDGTCIHQTIHPS